MLNKKCWKSAGDCTRANTNKKNTNKCTHMPTRATNAKVPIPRRDFQ